MPLQSIFTNMTRKLEMRLGQRDIEFHYDSDAVTFTIEFDLLSGVNPAHFDLRDYSTAEEFLQLVWEIRSIGYHILHPELLTKALSFLDNCCQDTFGCILDEAYKPGMRVNWQDWYIAANA